MVRIYVDISINVSEESTEAQNKGLFPFLFRNLGLGIICILVWLMQSIIALTLPSSPIASPQVSNYRPIQYFRYYPSIQRSLQEATNRHLSMS